mgnify:CR=1 FL=1
MNYKKERLKKSSLVMQDANYYLTDEVFKELSLGVKNFDE